jgi:hypothetical protein
MRNDAACASVFSPVFENRLRVARESATLPKSPQNDASSFATFPSLFPLANAWFALGFFSGLVVVFPALRLAGAADAAVAVAGVSLRICK